MSAGSIIIDLLMKTGSFETDTKRAGKELAALKKEAQQMGVAIGAAFSAAAIAPAYLVKSSIDAMDAMSKLSQQTGTTVESLSALSYAADLSGVSQDQLGSALVKLSKNMSDAAVGTGEAQRGFEALGISVKNADGTLKSSDKVLTEVAEKFANLKDGSDKTAIAVNLFGKAGAQLIPLLNSGAGGLEAMTAEAERLGIVLDTQTSKAAEQFNDNLTRVKAATQGLANAAATELLLALNQVSQMFVDLAKNQTTAQVGADVIKASVGGLINVFQTLAVVGSDVGFVFLSVGREIGAWAAQIGALARGDLTGFRAISDAVKEDGARARAELDKFQAAVMAIGRVTPSWGSKGRGQPSASGGLGTVRFSDTPTPKAGGGAAKVSEAERYLTALQKQLDRTRDLTAVEQVLSDIQSGRLKLSGNVTQERLTGIAAQIDANKNLTDQLSEEGKQYQQFLDIQRQLKDEGKRVYEATRTPIEKLAAEQLNLNKLLGEGVINWDTYARAVFAAQDAFDATVPIQKLTELDEFAKNAAKSIQGHIGDGLVDILSGNFSNIGKNFKSMLIRMAADAIAADLTRKLFGKDGKGDGLFGALLQGVGAFLGFGGAKAGGGPVSGGTTYLVGERGPELFVPRTAGAIVPNGALSSGNTGGNVTLINQSGVPLNVVQQQTMSNGDRALIIDDARRATLGAFVGQMSDPNSDVSRAYGRNFRSERKR